ncbi:ParA family protein [Sinanaerobacter sp. ZZT-01]|uniref:ParA family protein n=1 Tax=Sinanaerobacter sp. ZZT-01 TaxID=3111540 RepID=UPI002D7953AD|nr:ParA family protein [Sinanaerobacter sp. ZZT-01]WRR94211.1 ParA family protein [Sinanaerobacter sp. ZZT-01]
MGKVYAIINQKGGVGKTTTVFNMAAEMAEQGKKVLTIDMDPQGSLTTSMGQVPSELEYTIGDLFMELIDRKPLPDIKDYILSRGKVEYIPANLALSVADASIQRVIVAREYLLKKIIAPLRSLYDYIIIDCPPTLGSLVVNALTASDALIVPIKANDMDTKGFDSLIDTVEMIKIETNPSLKIEGVLLTMFDERLLEARDVLKTLEGSCEYFSIPIYRAKIGTSTKAARAFRQRKTIAEFDINSKISLSYKEFVREVLADE